MNDDITYKSAFTTNYVNYLDSNTNIEEWVRTRDPIPKVPEDKKDVREFNRAFHTFVCSLFAAGLAAMEK